MNGRERMQTIFRKETPDRMGLFEHYWTETLGDWVEQGYPTRDDGRPEHPGKVFDYDMGFAVGGNIDCMPRPGVQETVKETDEWRIVRNGAGAQLKFWKHKMGTPEHIAFEMTNRGVWEDMKGPLLELDPSRIHDIDLYRTGLARLRDKGKMVCSGTGFVFELMRSSLGDVCMMESFYLDPDWIKDFCSTYTEFVIRHHRYLFEEAGKPDVMFVYEDLGFTNGLWASPDLLAELVMPYHTQLVDFFHGEGLPVILHSCGDVRKGADMIVDCGWDCLQPMEAKVGNNVVEYAEQFGKRISYMGNINVVVLGTGDRGAIRKEVESKLVPLRDRGIPYVFHSDHSVPPTVSYDAYRYALDVFHEVEAY